MMGRRQRGVRILWSIVWELDRMQVREYLAIMRAADVRRKLEGQA